MTEYYTIQEAAELTQVSAHTLRFYERIGLLRNIARAENGHRRYSETDLGWVRFVVLLRATGMPLPQIAVFMKLEKEGQVTLDKRLQLLEAHGADLRQHIVELQRHLNALANKIAYYRNTFAVTCDCVQTEGESDGVPPARANGHQSEPLMSGNDDVRQRNGKI